MFVIFNTILCFVQCLVAIYGVTEIKHGDNIECQDDGKKWKFVTQFGNLFSTMHIFLIIFQAMMVEKIFYGIPHKAGMFDLLHDHEHELLHEHEKEQKEVEKGATTDGFVKSA